MGLRGGAVGFGGGGAGEGDVVSRVLFVGFGDGGVELPDDFGGRAEHEAVGRDDGVFGYEGMGSDDGAVADDGSVEHDGSHADEATVFYGAGVQDGAVAHGDVVAEAAGGSAFDVQAAEVLHVAAAPDFDGGEVGAQHGAVPDGAAVAESDVTDEVGAGGDEGGLLRLRALLSEGIHGHGLQYSAGAPARQGRRREAPGAGETACR